MTDSNKPTIEYSTAATGGRFNVRRILKHVAASLALVGVVCLVGLILMFVAIRKVHRKPVATATSPDGRYQATWVQSQRLIDFHYELHLDDLNGADSVCFAGRSPGRRKVGGHLVE